MRCRATDAVPDCWKVHPERFPVLAEIEIDEPNDEVSLRIAGD